MTPWQRFLISSLACPHAAGRRLRYPPALIRSASRNRAPPPGATLQNYRSAGPGFRVARDLP